MCGFVVSLHASKGLCISKNPGHGLQIYLRVCSNNVFYYLVPVRLKIILKLQSCENVDDYFWLNTCVYRLFCRI